MTSIYKIPYWVTKTKTKNQLFLFNWKNNKSVIIYDENHPANTLSEQKIIQRENFYSEEYLSDIDWLIESSFLQLESEKKEENFTPKKKISQQELHLIILPAGEACNLNCVYCYENHNYKKRMNDSDSDRLISFIKKQGSELVNIEYFGGEPMLNMKFIEDFSKKLTKNKIKYHAGITTNGTLLSKQNLEKLHKSGVKSFQITIDGARNLHNKLRISNSKNLNSYESVCNALKNIQQSCHSDINCVVRINSNKETIQKENLSTFIKDIKNIIPPDDHRFLIFPKPIGDYLSANLKDNSKAQSTYCDKSSANEVTEILEKAFFNQGYLLADPIMLTKNKGYACSAGHENSFVINPDFYIYKCTVALDDPINNVGKILEDGSLSINENFHLWTKDYSNESCGDCFANKTCTGNSCPLINIKLNEKKCPPFKNQIDSTTFKLVKFYERVSNA